MEVLRVPARGVGKVDRFHWELRVPAVANSAVVVIKSRHTFIAIGVAGTHPGPRCAIPAAMFQNVVPGGLQGSFVACAVPFTWPSGEVGEMLIRSAVLLSARRVCLRWVRGVSKLGARYRRASVAQDLRSRLLVVRAPKPIGRRGLAFTPFTPLTRFLKGEYEESMS